MEKWDEKQVAELFSEIKKALPEAEKIAEKKGDAKTDETANTKNKTEGSMSPIEKLENIFQEMQNEIKNLRERHLMAVAETQDTVRRFQNESQSVKKYGGEKLASEIIGPIDTFRKVLQTSPDDPQIKNYLIGFEMIINQMDQALNNAGVQIIPTKIGDDFSHHLHNAIEEVDTDAVGPGKICAIVSNGYKLHDRVIKHTVVKVAKQK